MPHWISLGTLLLKIAAVSTLRDVIKKVAVESNGCLGAGWFGDVSNDSRLAPPASARASKDLRVAS